MTPEVMTLPITPQTFWVSTVLLGVVSLTALIFGALRSMGQEHRQPIWEELPTRAQGLVVFLGLLWIGLLALTIVAAFLGVWEAIHPKDVGSQPNLGLGALLAALLGAPFLIWGTWLKYQTVRYQKEGHITDRINTAVEQLGAEKTKKVRGKDPDGKDITVEETQPNIEVRIGAILSLERIAQDSTIHDKGRDHVRVMEILCAYVRENAPAKSAQDSLRQIWTREKAGWDDAPDQFQGWFCNKYGTSQTSIDDLISVKASTAWASMLPKPRADIILTLQVIGRRTAEQRRVEAAWPDALSKETVWPFDVLCPRPSGERGEAIKSERALNDYLDRLKVWSESIRSYKGYRLDLQGTNLQGANLSPLRPDGSDAVYAGAILTDSRLEGANLRRVRMEGVSLGKACLQGAKLNEVRMEGAVLRRAQLEGTVLTEAHLKLTDVRWARLEGAHMRLAWLDGADLRWTQLDRVVLRGAHMERALLIGAGMHGTLLKGARIDGADFRGAQFDESTNWSAAWLRGAAVRMVDLSNTPISSDQVWSIFGDDSTKLPESLRRPNHWPKWKLPPTGDNSFNAQWLKWRADPDRYVPLQIPDGE